jgi:hypothetical protein
MKLTSIVYRLCILVILVCVYLVALKQLTLREGIENQMHITVYPPESIRNHISHVVYINLDSREDRRAQMEQELKVFAPEQVHRVPGIVPDILDMAHKNVALATAHLNAVKLARDNHWPNALFLEDDSVWANVERAYPSFERLIQGSYDAIMLGGHHAEYDEQTLRIKRATSGASYLLHESHYTVFIDRLQAMIDSFVSGVTIHDDVQGDTVVFGPLQKEYKWFIVAPSLMVQLPGNSDREGRYVDFTGVENQ